MEPLRTVVTILDEGSFTKAGHRLGLTQSAISAQIKRLRQLVGEDVFRGFLDMGMMILSPDKPIDLVSEWAEPISWGSFRRSARRPGMALPYVFWPNSETDRVAFEAMDKAGLARTSAPAAQRSKPAWASCCCRSAASPKC